MGKSRGGRDDAGTGLSLPEEMDKEHRVQYTIIIIENTSWRKNMKNSASKEKGFIRETVS